MATRQLRPTNPGSRTQSYSTFDEITRSTPEKRLTEGKKTYGGRTNKGRVSDRFRGGGHRLGVGCLGSRCGGIAFLSDDFGLRLDSRILHQSHETKCQ